MLIKRTDAGDGSQQFITEEDAKQRLQGSYENVDIVINVIKEGQTVRTPFAFYERI